MNDLQTALLKHVESFFQLINNNKIMKKLIISILLFASQLAVAQTGIFDNDQCITMETYYNEVYYMWEGENGVFSITSDNGWDFQNLSESQAYEALSIIRGYYDLWDDNESLLFYDQEGQRIDAAERSEYMNLTVVNYRNGGQIIGVFWEGYGFLPRVPRRFFTVQRL